MATNKSLSAFSKDLSALQTQTQSMLTRLAKLTALRTALVQFAKQWAAKGKKQVTAKPKAKRKKRATMTADSEETAQTRTTESVISDEIMTNKTELAA